jgi:uncharacterized SAM-binding protein YcdF (DUF218 family)
LKSLAILILLLTLWVVGLLAFADRAAKATPVPEPAVADGVVALTGASSARIDAAIQLLELGKGKRLLISGVNPEVRPRELRDVARGAGNAYDCCVDLGFKAANTLGNARETAAWVKKHRFRSLIVVTADYHMPRSMLELRAAMPGVKLQAYPVATETLDARRWWRDGGEARRLAVEYTKYLVILGREGLRRLGGDRPQSEPAAAEKVEEKASA